MTNQAQLSILPTPESVEILLGVHLYAPGETIAVGPAPAELGHEGYELEVTEDEILIGANSAAGEFYARQTLQQLVDHSSGNRLPCVRIADRPRFSWRSFMIDSGRQFQQLETIKGLLDRMAMLKLNIFHWHLTENDGWRIEIREHPKLTEVGAFVAQGKEQHGFYTQEAIREVVAYAADRNITVVPEIDVPGHAEAALQAYPHLTCAGRFPEAKPKGHSPILFCGGRDDVTAFLCEVLDEVCELFPAETIHLGGDEAPKSEWEKCPHCRARIEALGLQNEHELQIDLTNRLARHLAARGRQAICWGDVVTLPGPEMEENIIIHWWNWRRHRDKALREGVRRRRKVIANTNFYTYLNFPQKHPSHGYDAPRLFDLQTCYEENPSDIICPFAEERDALLGLGACLWTDNNLTEEWLDLRLYPRLFALAEQMWSRAERLPYREFKDRVYAKRDILATHGIDGDWDEQH